MHIDFIERLNQSPWKGIISEVGMGLEFSSRLLRVPGASQTVLGVNCDYAGLDRPDGMRAVSLENATLMASNNLAASKFNLIELEPSDHRFGLAITGAHYPDRESHGWICLKTDQYLAYMHFSLEKRDDRQDLGRWVSMIAAWFVEECLLNTEGWTSRLTHVHSELNFARIDVLYAPGVSDFERLLLLKEDKALVYHRGTFHRVVDYLRESNIIYPGAFNPPTTKHLDATALFEISQSHFYKGNVDAEDLLHRVRMLDLEDKPTLITRAPRFVDKYRLIKSYSPTAPVNFLVGADAWNATIIAHQYPNHPWLSDMMRDAHFIIMPREGVSIDKTPVSDHLDFIIREPGHFEDQSSTAVRGFTFSSEHKFVTNKIGQYILKHELYQTKFVL